MKIAIDVVLLPPEEIMDLAVEINKRAVEKGNATIELDKQKRIPHLSLLMGVLDLADLPQVTKLMEEAAKQFHPLMLMVDKVDQECFVIKTTEDIQTLHKLMIKRIDSFLSHQATKEMYLEEENYQLCEDFEYWVNEFVNQKSLENFWPHITFHSPEENPVSLPFSFTASRLALCHLGDHNTCRKILFQTELK